MKILVVYFSRSGFTRTLAEQIAEACGADIESIKEVGSRRGPGGYLRSVIQAAMHRDTKIRACQFKPVDYDLVVIGTPVWCWNMSSPVRTYIDMHRGQFARVALFCTYGGSGNFKVLDDMEHLCGKPVSLTLAVTTQEIQRGQYDDSLAEFVTSLQEAPRPRRRGTGAPRTISKVPAP